MLISKKELFKRKNRNTLYHIYEDAVNTLASVTEQYEAKLKTIRELKDKYKNSEHIYHLLTAMENDMTSSFYVCSFYQGQLIKSSNFIVDLKVYQCIHNHIARLLRAVGTIGSLIDTLTYLDRNELGVRSI